jgi:chitinase
MAALALASWLTIAGSAPPRVAAAAAPHRVVYYYQTLTDLSPVLTNLNPATHRPYATDVFLASFHLGRMRDGSRIHLNDHPPDDPVFATPWRQLAALQADGVKVHAMLGGAARGSYTALFAHFGTFYPILRKTLRAHHLDGIDLDVEEPVKLGQVERLITQLSADFGPSFVITLAPVASALSGGGNLSGFDYRRLFRDPAGAKVAWLDAQFYSGFGTLASTASYDRVVAAGFPPDRLVAGVLSSPSEGGGFVDVNTVASTVTRLSAKYPTFGGVFTWEYFDALPGGPSRPDEWSALMSRAMP